MRPRRLLLHLDIDAFLASVVQLTEPGLYGQPVAVGSGVVASRSYEAKARGVATAMPIQEALRLCPELIVCEGDAQLAARFRSRVGAIVSRLAPKVELTSLDDLYADLGGLTDDPVALAAVIRAGVRQETGLSVSQGIGATKTLARLATKRAKPGGIVWVRPGEEREFLARLPVGEIPGIGPKTAATLAGYGISTVAELRLVDRDLLRESFGKRGEAMWYQARGLPSGDEDQELEGPDGSLGGAWSAQGPMAEISRTTSLHEATADRAYLRAMLAYLADRAARKLRELGRAAQRVDVGLVLASGGPQDGRSREAPRRSPTGLARGVALPAPTACGKTLASRALALLDDLLAEHRCLVRKVGVHLSRFAPAARGRQERLFLADALALRAERLDDALDHLRARHGFGAVLCGEATGLLGKLALGRDGYRLRTPSLTL